MAQSLNLQRNSEVFLSTINIQGGAAASSMTPSNTWKVEVLAGFAMSQAAATQDISAMETGTTPDRSSQRFKTAINPVEWNFQTYLRPTGVESNVGYTVHNTAGSSNSKPTADWYLWQSLISNTSAGVGDKESSVWQASGTFGTATRASTANTFAHNSNFGSSSQYHLYFKLDNVVYQVANAVVNQAVVDAAIDGIATTTWSGLGATLHELTNTNGVRDNAIAVFGGVNAQATVTTAANACATNLAKVASYHPYATWNTSISGSTATASFIKNRLSSISVQHTTEAGALSTYTFPVTALSLTYNNNITYLTPEELSVVNAPIGQFTGAREVTGSFTAYLRGADGDSGQFLRNLVADTRPTHISVANANLIIGGTTAPYVAFNMPAVLFDIPTHGIDDIITVAVNFKAQEPSSTEGNGGEMVIVAKK